MRLDITCSTDDNYVQHCMAMLCSVFANNAEHTVYVHLLHSNLSTDSQNLFTHLTEKYSNIIYFYKIDNEALAGVNFRKNSPVTIAAYYRLLLPTLLDESIKRVLYLDCDVIVLKDISCLFGLHLDNYGVAALSDCTPYNDEHRRIMGLALNDPAFCSGVMMINLDYWREHNCQQRLFERASIPQEHVYYEDQDALNHVFKGHWFQLPYQYGHTPLALGALDDNQKASDRYENAYDPSIIHYAAHVKPWHSVWFPEREHYWYYVRLSGFPDPKIIPVKPIIKKNIRKATMRYLINRYIRPFVPDILEILLKDIWRLFKLFSMIFTPSKFKRFTLQCWLHKYGK